MSIIYHTDGEGHWIKQEFPEQCEHEIVMASRCQGVKGHAGKHWCYKPNGSFVMDEEGGDTVDTPPGHDRWVSPVDMVSHYYVSQATDSEVTDPDKIARLERGEMGEAESIVSPVPDDEARILMNRLGMD